MSSLLLRNIGTIVSGDIAQPTIGHNAIRLEDGKIARIFDLAAGESADVIITSPTPLQPETLTFHWR